MVQLRCNDCKYFDEATSVCNHLKEYLPNGYAKFYFGGAIGRHFGNAKYSGKCGQADQAKERLKIGLISDSEKKPILSTISRVKSKS